jgi:hypothetical protein
MPSRSLLLAPDFSDRVLSGSRFSPKPFSEEQSAGDDLVKWFAHTVETEVDRDPVAVWLIMEELQGKHQFSRRDLDAPKQHILAPSGCLAAAGIARKGMGPNSTDP